MHDCIRGEIGKLSDAYRNIFMLSALGGLSNEEIAQTLGISEGNARVRLHRARQEFKKIIETRCDFYRNELSCKPSSPDCCARSAALSGPTPVAERLKVSVTLPSRFPSNKSGRKAMAAAPTRCFPARPPSGR